MKVRVTHSLRGRLLWFLLAAITIAAVAQASIAYRTALNDADQIFDYHMQQMALSLRSRVPLTSTEDANADVKLFMPADIGDRFWRGEYNLAVGLARGQVKAKGPINKILKLVPLTKPLFPIYREMIAEKEAAPV